MVVGSANTWTFGFCRLVRSARDQNGHILPHTGQNALTWGPADSRQQKHQICKRLYWVRTWFPPHCLVTVSSWIFSQNLISQTIPSITCPRNKQAGYNEELYYVFKIGLNENIFDTYNVNKIVNFCEQPGFPTKRGPFLLYIFKDGPESHMSGTLQDFNNYFFNWMETGENY